MDSSLSTVVTRSSESKHNYAPVYTGEYELDYHYHSDNTRNNKSRSIWSRSKNLVWNKCNSIWRYFRHSNNLQYHNSRSRLSVRDNRKISWSNRNNRHRKRYNYRFHYYFLLSLLTISPAYADTDPETNNVSNPVAAATGNVTNQAVQFQNNGAPSRQQYGGNISCNGSTMTFSPFYMGNHTKPWEMDEEIGMNPSSYTLSENWGFQINFMVPLDKSGLEQCRRMAARQEEKMKLDYELTRALKCAQLQKSGFTLLPKTRVYHMCSDVVPIKSLLPKDKKENVSTNKTSRFNIFKKR